MCIYLAIINCPLCARAHQSWEYKGVQDRHVPLKIFLIFTDFFIQLFTHLLSSYYEPSGALLIGGTAMNRITPKLRLPEAPNVPPGDSGKGTPNTASGAALITSL